MKALRYVAIALLVVVTLAAAFAPRITRADYETQFREAPDSPPSAQHWLGTDALGRDRFARLVYGSRVSLALAPAAALLATLLAAVLGGAAGHFGGWTEKFLMGAADLVLSLPWLFLLLLVRAMLPLNVSPIASAVASFVVLGTLGWAASARVVCASVKQIRNSDLVLFGHAMGMPPLRLLLRFVLPNVAPVLAAQFWISVPLFVIAEGNLSVLGLGVAEPLPSWGSMLRELEGMLSISAQPWKLAPLALLVIVMSSFQIVFSQKEVKI